MLQLQVTNPVVDNSGEQAHNKAKYTLGKAVWHMMHALELRHLRCQCPGVDGL